MKIKIIILILSILSISSCEHNCKENMKFKKQYFDILDIFVSYYKFMNTNEDIPVSLLWEMNDQIYKNRAYIEYLTQKELRYIEVEHILIYQNKADFEADMKDLKKWYKENKCGMTIEKADSIIKSTYKQLKKDSMQEI